MQTNMQRLDLQLTTDFFYEYNRHIIGFFSSSRLASSGCCRRESNQHQYSANPHDQPTYNQRLSQANITYHNSEAFMVLRLLKYQLTLVTTILLLYFDISIEKILDFHIKLTSE